MSIKTPVSGQKKSSSEATESKKRQGEGRFRKRLHITLDPSIYEWLKKSTDNASKLIESLLNSVSQGIQPLAFIISAKTEPGPGFEPGSADLQSAALPLCHPGLKFVITKFKKLLVFKKKIFKKIMN